MPNGAIYDVFLCHATKDKTAVEAIAHKLRGRKIRPFLDIWHLVPGDPLQKALEDALDSSQTFAVFVSSGSLGPWQNLEMRNALEIRAQDEKRRIIPVLLPGDYDPTKELSGFLRQHLWVDFRYGDNSEALHRLICGIKGSQPNPSKIRPRSTATRTSATQATYDAPSLSEPKSEFFEKALTEIDTRLTKSSKDICVLGLPGSGASTTLKELAKRRPDIKVINWRDIPDHQDLKDSLPSAGVVAVLGHPNVRWLAKLKPLVDSTRVRIVAASAVAPDFMEPVLMPLLSDNDLVTMLEPAWSERILDAA